MEKLELHYYLSDKSHSMDAFIKNKAESDLLKIFKEISNILELDLSFEIEALTEGGIKEFFKILKKKKNKIANYQNTGYCWSYLFWSFNKYYFRQHNKQL